ncbi:MAG TPA: TetR/AcrR family transcriptional regulator, partial [Thermoanaerobaculia bacterium]|nr:TetR/AcrR family transcriptional regulator [Thermoanaerobaculia bacterium]
DPGHDLRRRRAFQRTREGILDSAAITFARKGFRGTTMSDIASAAGYTPPTLYAYFRSKSEIFTALIDQVLDQMGQTYAEEQAPGLSFEQRLHLLIGRQLDLAQKRRHAFAVFYAIRPLEQDVPAGKRDETGFDFCVGRLARWIREASTDIERRGWSPEDLAYALAGMIHAFVRRSLRDTGDGRLGRDGRLVVELFLNGMRGGSPKAGRGSRGRRQGNGG